MFIFTYEYKLIFLFLNKLFINAIYIYILNENFYIERILYISNSLRIYLYFLFSKMDRSMSSELKIICINE